MNEGHNQQSVAIGDAPDGVRPFAQSRDGLRLRSDGALKICAWCQKIPVGTDRWVRLDEALLTLRIISKDMLERATHGVCPDCFHGFLSGIHLPKTSTATAIADGHRFTLPVGSTATAR